jgi:hypothetical protein
MKKHDRILEGGNFFHGSLLRDEVFILSVQSIVMLCVLNGQND